MLGNIHLDLGLASTNSFLILYFGQRFLAFFVTIEIFFSLTFSVKIPNMKITSQWHETNCLEFKFVTIYSNTSFNS